MTEGAQSWLLYLAAFSIAALIALWITPRLRKAAISFGIVDAPDGRLKTHSEPVPYLGGLAIYLAFLLALAVTLEFGERVLGLLLAGSIVVIVGLIDDLGQLGPWTKLAAQGVAVFVLVKSGTFIKLTFLPYPLAIALSVLWMLAIINAFNLIDIMDGLSAGNGAIAAIVLMLVAASDGGTQVATLLAAMAGACLGFLRYNFQPARIYMGDTGSMFLGLMLGAMAMDNAYTQRNVLGALAPVMVLGVPLFDMLFVMYIRQRRGLPVMLGSPDHIALRLRKWRLNTRQTVLLSYAVTGLLGAAAFGITRVPIVGALAILGALVVLAALSTIWLRRIDMGL